MNKLVALFCSLLILLALQSKSSTSHAQGIKGEYLAHEVLVKLERGTQLTGDGFRKFGADKLQEFGVTGWVRLRLPAGVTVGEAIGFYRQLTGVARVQPNFVYRVQTAVNDPRFAELYGLNKISAPAAWEKTTGNSAVVVAVIDLGVNYDHEDLSANMWRNPGETGMDAQGHNKATNSIDDDDNGYVDDVYGIDTINHDSNPADDGGHGTHVAGTIGAVGNNNKGVVGVNWAVSIMAIKSHDSAGNGTSASVIEAFQYATMMRQRGVNVRVTNNSWGGAPEAAVYDQALKDAIEAAGSAGILNVCAAGNANNNNDANPFYPASYDSPSIIAVAASDQNDNRAGFSSYGATSVDLAAPGVGILSTYGNSYTPLSGTSMATPHVSGAAALISAFNPYLTVTQLKSSLLNNVDTLPQWSGLTVAGGRLNVLRALQSIPTTNEIDSASFFVRQHYLDFLAREPDAEGLAYWVNEIASCGNDVECVHSRRIGVSGAFFVEPEFQDTGSFVYRLYKASFGRVPSFVEFSADRPQVLGGVNLDQDKVIFADNWVSRDSFKQAYPLTMTAEHFVNKLFDTAQLFPFAQERQAEIDALQSNSKSRADVLRTVIEIAEFKTREYNPSFVLMEYFGYLQRDPDQKGYDFWLDVLTNRERGNYRGMICAFITSAEYQLRFAPVVTHTNQECAN
ncbi:MAG TPA: S8 family serine peptidase [Pyrinomonadaceae bacterium]|nr:S8 family serine peptidase [Pyrinomonadaceae bacterium]